MAFASAVTTILLATCVCIVQSQNSYNSGYSGWGYGSGATNGNSNMGMNGNSNTGLSGTQMQFTIPTSSLLGLLSALINSGLLGNSNGGGSGGLLGITANGGLIIGGNGGTVNGGGTGVVGGGGGGTNSGNNGGSIGANLDIFGVGVMPMINTPISGNAFVGIGNDVINVNGNFAGSSGSIFANGGGAGITLNVPGGSMVSGNANSPVLVSNPVGGVNLNPTSIFGG